MCISGLLKLLRDDPGAFEKHFKYFTAGVVLEVCIPFLPCIISVTRVSSQFMDLISGLTTTPTYELLKKAQSSSKVSCRVHSWLMPSLSVRFFRTKEYLKQMVTVRYLPEWFPGAAFKKQARIWGKSMMDSIVEPFKAVSSQHVSLSSPASFPCSPVVVKWYCRTIIHCDVVVENQSSPA